MVEPLRPDAVIGPEGHRWPDTRSRVKEAALALPNLVKLLGRLVRDPRVPTRSKALAGAALAYVASPIDLLPDLIPVLGRSDDVFVAIFACMTRVYRLDGRTASNSTDDIEGGDPHVHVG